MKKRGVREVGQDEDRDAYDEGRDAAYGSDDDLDEVAGSAHEGDEYEYFAQEWADQD